jgi:hypothetical protein
MLNPQKYFSAIADKRRELDAAYPNGFLYIASVRNLDRNTTAGSVSEVSTILAARGIIDSTHRLLTAEEVAAFEIAEEARRKLIVKDDGVSIKRRVRSLLGDNR